MRSPSIFGQCLPGIFPQERRARGVSVVPERDVNVPSPAVEILPAKVYTPHFLLKIQSFSYD